MVLPLDAAGDVIGALIVQSEEADAFGQADVITLQVIADQLAIAINNSRLYRQIRDLLYQSERRARLLGAANAVGHTVASILDLDQLLPKTVDTICETYGFYYAGIFLIDEEEQWAVLRSGRGEAGAAMIAAGHKLALDGNSMIGTAIREREARVAVDVGEEAVFFRNPHLPRTRSEAALPLVMGAKALGAITVQSAKERDFGPDDVSTLQAMADHLSVAIHNAQAVQELERVNQEIVRTKTFEAIATATGEAIHWVGNKAAPIPASVSRVTEDVTQYLALAMGLVNQAPPELRQHKFAQLLTKAQQDITAQGIQLDEIWARLERQPLKRLCRMLNVGSIFEDLDIIQAGADSILNIKEDLMGPARQRKVEVVSLPKLLTGVVS
ncbi:MAG: GAF domain-containing protein, partial [Delftia sp.]|nr:GAF domain-containing protein [Delftia sp.]